MRSRRGCYPVSRGIIQYIQIIKEATILPLLLLCLTMLLLFVELFLCLSILVKSGYGMSSKIDLNLKRIRFLLNLPCLFRINLFSYLNKMLLLLHNTNLYPKINFLLVDITYLTIILLSINMPILLNTMQLNLNKMHPLLLFHLRFK